MAAIDLELLKANWENQLTHQINELLSVESYIADLNDAIAWWLEPALEKNKLSSMPRDQVIRIERQFYPKMEIDQKLSSLDQIRRAAKNRFLVLVEYKGFKRLVELYSLRHPSTGNELLHVWEIEKNGQKSNSHKSFKTDRWRYIEDSKLNFSPKWIVEL